MIIPEDVKPVHHNTFKSILKKVRVAQPVTAQPTPIEQVMNVDLANAEGAARAHARSKTKSKTTSNNAVLESPTSSSRTGVKKHVAPWVTSTANDPQ